MIGEFYTNFTDLKEKLFLVIDTSYSFKTSAYKFTSFS
jgi:hypothetical protein